MTTFNSEPREASPWDWFSVCLLTLVLLSPNWPFLYREPSLRYWVGQCATSFLLLACFLHAGLRIRTILILFLPFSALAPGVFMFGYFTKAPLSFLTLRILKEATAEELSIYRLYLMIGVAMGLVVVVCNVLLIRRLWAVAVRPRRYVRVLGFVLAICLLFKDVRSAGLDMRMVTIPRLEKMYPVSLCMATGRLIVNSSEIPDRSHLLTEGTSEQRPKSDKREVCVLVIGESARRRAFDLYQHPERSPLVGRASELVLYGNTTACGTATIQAVPILLTGQFPGGGEWLPFSKAGLVEAYRLAGFHTVWVSTQAADGDIDSCVSVFSANAHERRFLNGRLGGAFIDGKDEAMLPVLREVLSQRHDKLFVVLHMLGSHLPYLKRYPAAFERAPVSADARSNMENWMPPYSGEQRTQIDHAYGNTMFYTEWFLGKVMESLEKESISASLAYISDHGENDASADVLPACHCVASPDVLNIPMFFWFSTEYRACRGSKVENLIRHRNLATSAEDLYSTMCDLGDLRNGQFDEYRSLASGAYEAKPRRVLMMDDRVLPLP